MGRTNPADTPLMRQYLQIKERHPDAILFFRLGDFYEMFFEDAVIAARALDLTLTSRDKGRDDGVPMAGVPHHAARSYVARLTELGHKVVLCEQTEDPKKAKGLVKREVVRIVTPGIVLDDEVLDPKTARYLAAVCRGEQGFGFAYLDVSTGEFRATELIGLDALAGELARVQPRELLANDDDVRRLAPGCAHSPVSVEDPGLVAEILELALANDLAGLGLADAPLAAQAAAAAITYARDTQPAGVLPLNRLQVYRPGHAVVLDEAAVANLELCATLAERKKAGSLLGVLDHTQTAPGGRLLRRWLLYPLTEVAPIRRRQDAVAYLVEHAALRRDLRTQLARFSDLERLAGRVSLRVATPRDLGLIRGSLERLPALRDLLAAEAADMGLPDLLAIDRDRLEELGGLAARIAAVLVDEPPPLLKDGGVIRDGFCPMVDEHRLLASGGKDSVLAIERRERERTGISSLKVKYNRVFGYYIEVTRAHLDKVPDDYIRKQTIATGERYVTDELAELESKILSAQDTLHAREAELFNELCDAVCAYTAQVSAMGQRIAEIDTLAALAEVAHQSGYVRPTVEDSEVIDIADGRHPVVETVVPPGAFVPNDCRIDSSAEQVLLITGPNMAGKSTFMRQVAQIVLMAQMGSFVPARSATIGIVDRVFARVGAADNLARGESTFMVEMRETATILSSATRRSLVVLDEVGRGTSTFDGVSIAWAVTEFLHDAIGARTLFATHYHELCALARARPRVRNLCVAVREHGGKIVFLRRVVEGGANRSYGIEVARLAGLPRSTISRARQILAELEGARQLGGAAQLDLFAAASAPPAEPQPPDHPHGHVLAALRDVDVDTLTPIEALTLLASLRQQLHSAAAAT
jgi:DNA mismatch repair protein MutS